MASCLAMTKRRSPTILAWSLSVSFILAPSAQSQPGHVTLKAARAIDGAGNVLEDAVITVVGSTITAVGRQSRATGPVTYELGPATVMPGMIDVHVHPEYYFGPGGKYGESNVPRDFER